MLTAASASLLESILTVGLFFGIITATVVAQVWAQRRHRRHEDADGTNAEGAEAMLGGTSGMR